jgi:hypothetical protein
VRAGDLDGLGDRNLFLILGMAGHPFAGVFVAIDSKFESAATGNAAKDAREFFVVLKFQPVNKTVPIATAFPARSDL